VTGSWKIFAAAAIALMTVGPANAGEQDKDLDLIPGSVQQNAPVEQPAVSGGGSQINYLENAFSATGLRGGLAVPFPPPAPSTWENRLFFDSRDEWRLSPDLTLTYSGRFNLRAAQGVPFPSHEDVRNDLREAFVSWKPMEGIFFDLGRVNLKSGVASGYNPTDFFRTRAVVEPLTADPTVLREDRLGTLMLLGQYVWSGGSVTAAFAPRVTTPTAIYTNLSLPSFDPMLDRTNAADRFFLKGSVEVADGFSPELVLYHEGNRTQVGTNLTTGIGKQTILYLEWAGGVRDSLIDDALRYGRNTGTLPASAPAVIPGGAMGRFRNDLSVGLSWTPESTKLTFNLEYHFHEAGFSRQDWNNWFNTAARLGNIPGVDRSLWYIRSYAQDQQEPLSRHIVFARASWTDAFVPDLQLTALANISLLDGSGLVQATADYYLSRAWTLGGLASFTFGSERSEFGSLPQVGSFLLRAVRYF
jgi:hypothetical protein